MKCFRTLAVIVCVCVAVSPAHGQVQEYVRRGEVDETEQWSDSLSRDLWSWNSLFSWVCKPLHHHCEESDDDGVPSGSNSGSSSNEANNNENSPSGGSGDAGNTESASASASSWGFLVGALVVATLAAIVAFNRRRRNNTEGGSHPLNSSVSKRMDLVSRAMGCTKVSPTDVDDGDNELARRTSTKAHADYVQA